MSDDLIARAEEAMKGVTRGPWTWDDHRVPTLSGRAGDPETYEYDIEVIEAEHQGECGCRSACNLYLHVGNTDGDFIAAARDLVPELVAALAAERARVERVKALAEKWRYKGEFGWGSWQEGQGPDMEGQILDDAAHALFVALADPEEST